MNRLEHKGFFAKIMEAERLVGDLTFGLPPGTPLEVYHADAFKSYPENWMKGPGVFVVPVKPNKGLWFDWRDNDSNNTAIIPTVKGCNPITGLQTTGFHLEKYETKCPKHGCDFKAERFCIECGYKWPDRGYVSGNPLWWDGFRSGGDVRQFFFTEEMMRDVATHMIGKENTVPAFGFAFYSPKERRASASTITRGSIYHIIGLEPKFNYLTTSTQYYSSDCTTKSVSKGFPTLGALGSFGEIKSKGLLSERSRSAKRSRSANHINNDSFHVNDGDTPMGYCCDALAVPCAGGASANVTLDESSTSMEYPLPDALLERSVYVPKKEVAVGAGAKIRQELPVDSYALDSWRDTPDSVMTIYFVFQEEFLKMAAAGFNDFKDCKDGMLSGLPIG
jgi:hypothetical protein